MCACVGFVVCFCLLACLLACMHACLCLCVRGGLCLTTCVLRVIVSSPFSLLSALLPLARYSVEVAWVPTAFIQNHLRLVTYSADAKLLTVTPGAPLKALLDRFWTPHFCVDAFFASSLIQFQPLINPTHIVGNQANPGRNLTHSEC